MSIEEEYILCAAIHFDDDQVHVHQPKNVLTGIVICGRRHNNALATLSALGINRLDYGHGVQGFITNLNRFVDREEAAKIAFMAKQIKEEKKKLYSEDLY